MRPSVRDPAGGGDWTGSGAMYCGLCHTLSQRYGQAARFILNYDFTYLAILLSDGTAGAQGAGRCYTSPIKKRPYLEPTAAMELAADESVILAYWQLRDGVEDHAWASGLKYRAGARLLESAYKRAAAFGRNSIRRCAASLQLLSALEQAKDPSMDRAADTFAVAAFQRCGGAGRTPSGGGCMEQILYHLGRWVYLIDAADDLKKDAESGNYNPVALRYGLTGRHMGRRRAAGTLPRPWTTPSTRWPRPLSCGISACGRRSCRPPFTQDCFRWDKPCWTARFHRPRQERTSERLRKPHERSISRSWAFPETATDEEIKKAYRKLARKYHPDNYHDSPLADLAQEKMKDINAAYEQITKERSGRGEQLRAPAAIARTPMADTAARATAGGDSVFQQVRYRHPDWETLSRAEALLANYSDHNAEWNFLKGVVCYRRGWMDEAKRYYQTACQMDPGNLEYQRALDYMENGPRQAYTPGGTTFGTDLCGSNLCLPMCCLWSLCSGSVPICCCC